MSNEHLTLDEVRDEIYMTIDDIARRGTQRMLAAALEVEAEAYLARHGQKDEQSRAQVVRNDYAGERTIQSGAGLIKVKSLWINDKRPDQKFTSRILPPYMRKTPRLEEAVPILYLRGLSTGDFREALAGLVIVGVTPDGCSPGPNPIFTRSCWRRTRAVPKTNSDGSRRSSKPSIPRL